MSYIKELKEELTALGGSDLDGGGDVGRHSGVLGGIDGIDLRGELSLHPCTKPYHIYYRFA